MGILWLAHSFSDASWAFKIVSKREREREERERKERRERERREREREEREKREREKERESLYLRICGIVE